MKRTILFSTSLLFAFMTQAQNINAVTPLKVSIGRYEKFEATITLTAAFTNPYDYDQIAVKGIFTAPSGRRDTLEGFFLQDFDLNTTSGSLITKGTGEWHIRFAPNEIGNWQYAITVQTPTGTSAASTGNFTCNASITKGFIRKNATNYLGFDSGDQYIPIGQNLCWHSGNPYLTYKNWLDKMGAAKANYMRLWLCHWGLGLEWKTDQNTGYQGLRKYKQNNAWYLDWLLEKCREQGIYMMFCINHHGQVSSQVNPNWNESPYNTANGGMCAQTWNFFDNDNAKLTHKNRLRYIVARWGYSPQIMSWELFNEVNWTDAYTSASVKTAVRTWHEEMSKYLKQIDPFKHLVSTSYGAAEDPELWRLPNMDFTQTHNYLTVPNIEKAIADDNKKFVQDYNKPNICSEFGIDVGTGTGTQAADPTGVHLHNTLWATAFSGAMGAGATWWWDSYTDPQNLYKEFTPLSIFIQNVAFKADNYKPATATVSGGTIKGDITASPSGDWAQTTDANFSVDASGISAGRLGQYIYGAQWNTQYRNPPIFTVTYPSAGQFKLTTAGTTGQDARVSIYVDGSLTFNTPAEINKTYSINIPAGMHTIKVDNLGTDWFRISEYNFVGLGGAPINPYVLKSANSDKATGWIHNRRYNWKEFQTAIPPSVNGTFLTLFNMINGTYDIKIYSCSSGSLLSTSTANVSNTNLTFTIPDLAWDMAFTATRSGATSTKEVVAQTINLKVYPNPSHAGEILMLDTEGVETGVWILNIIGVTGQILRSEKIEIEAGVAFSIKTEGLGNGLFFLNLSNGQKAAVTRFRLIQ